MFSDSFDAFFATVTAKPGVGVHSVNHEEIVKFDKVLVNAKNNYYPKSGNEASHTQQLTSKSTPT